MISSYKHSQEDDARLMALLTSGTQTTERRREIIATLDSSTLCRLLKRFNSWEARFQDGAINAALIREALQQREHAEMSLAILKEVTLAPMP
jgi:hypothetical protein